MKKLKIDRSSSKKFVALSLMSIITLMSLMGCSNNTNYYFKGENLENVSLITLENNEFDIASSISDCSPRICNKKHNVYTSIVTGKMFTDDNCKVGYSADYLGTKLNKYPIEKVESIISYLTVEEITKANKNELTEKDISSIIERILENKNSTEKTKRAN